MIKEVTIHRQQANNAIQWIEVLRTNTYKHGKGCLGDDKYGFCCLGVVCKILGIIFHCYNKTSNEVCRLTGLIHPNGAFVNEKNYRGASSLTVINDTMNSPFTKIARLMRTSPEWMFTPKVADLIKQHYR